MIENASEWAKLSESALYSSLSLSKALLAMEKKKFNNENKNNFSHVGDTSNEMEIQNKTWDDSEITFEDEILETCSQAQSARNIS